MEQQKSDLPSYLKQWKDKVYKMMVCKTLRLGATNKDINMLSGIDQWYEET